MQTIRFASEENLPSLSAKLNLAAKQAREHIRDHGYIADGGGDPVFEMISAVLF